MNPCSTSDSSPLPDGITRRTVLRASVVGAGIGADGLLAGCGGGGSNDASTDPGGSGSGGSADSGAGDPLVKTTDVPVGSGTILSGPQVVVTQPTSGDFKAFSSICTHQQCPVSRIVKDTIICDCHHSAYKITDGSTTVNPETGRPGPAPRALPAVPVTVQGNEVLKA